MIKNQEYCIPMIRTGNSPAYIPEQCGDYMMFESKSLGINVVERQLGKLPVRVGAVFSEDGSFISVEECER